MLQVPLGRGAYVRGRLALLQAIGDSHGCRTVFEVHDRGTVALVAGFHSDLDTVELLYNSLHTQAASRMAAERRATPAATQQWRRSFMFGYAQQIRSMLKATADEAVQRVHPSSAALPALRARDKRVEEYSRQQFGRVVAARQPKPATVTGLGGRQARRQPGRPRARPPARGPSDRQRAVTVDDGAGGGLRRRDRGLRGHQLRGAHARSTSSLRWRATITTASWWPHGDIAVVPARADADSSSARQRGEDRPTVRLAAPQMTPATLVHEFAHVLAGVGSGHGPLSGGRTSTWPATRSASAEAGWLLEAYAAMQLAPGAPSLGAAPPVRDGRAASARCAVVAVRPSRSACATRRAGPR